MLFKRMSGMEKKSVNVSSKLTISFYMIALTIHAIYSFIKTSELSFSFYLLVAGLILFYGSEYYYNHLKKSGRSTH